MPWNESNRQVIGVGLVMQTASSRGFPNVCGAGAACCASWPSFKKKVHCTGLLCYKIQQLGWKKHRQITGMCHSYILIIFNLFRRLSINSILLVAKNAIPAFFGLHPKGENDEIGTLPRFRRTRGEGGLTWQTYMAKSCRFSVGNSSISWWYGDMIEIDWTHQYIIIRAENQGLGKGFFLMQLSPLDILFHSSNERNHPTFLYPAYHQKPTI